jgi:hypothetical protein
VFHRHTFPAQVLPVQVVHGVISIAGVVKLNKAVRILQQNFSDAAVPFEEPFDVPLTHFIG